jgi:hypothetical protein
MLILHFSYFIGMFWMIMCETIEELMEHGEIEDASHYTFNQ